MAEEKPCRIRVRWPSGAEFEAEGSAEFIAREGREIMSRLEPGLSAELISPGGPGSGPRAPEIEWPTLIELRGRHLQLRAKLRGDSNEKDACLALLAASEAVLHQPKPTATQLAKWLRNSGYPIGRVDRSLQDAIAKGEILSSGSRRARRYELTAPGRLRALLLAEQLATTIHG